MLYNYCFWEVKIIACSVGAWSRISPTFVSIFNVDYEKAVNKLFLWQKKKNSVIKFCKCFEQNIIAIKSKTDNSQKC